MANGQCDRDGIEIMQTLYNKIRNKTNEINNLQNKLVHAWLNSHNTFMYTYS